MGIPLTSLESKYIYSTVCGITVQIGLDMIKENAAVISSTPEEIHEISNIVTFYETDSKIIWDIFPENTFNMDYLDTRTDLTIQLMLWDYSKLAMLSHLCVATIEEYSLYGNETK